jgi:hypothetical protein
VFPNIQPEETLITLRYDGKPEFKKDYVISYEQSLKLSVELTLYAVDCESPLFVTKIREAYIQFPPQNYTWLEFTDMFTQMYLNKFGNSITITDNRFKFVESHKDFKPYIRIQFSQYFVELFQIDHTEYSAMIPKDRYDIGFIRPPSLEENKSMIIRSPYMEGDDAYIEIDDVRVFYLRRQYWTYDLLKNALKAWSENQTTDSWLTSISLNTAIRDGKNTYELIFVANPLKKGGRYGDVHIVFYMSLGFSNMYNGRYSAFTINEVRYDSPYVIEIDEFRLIEKSTSEVIEASMSIKEIYANPTELVHHLNQVLRNLQQKIIIERPGLRVQERFFYIVDGNASYYSQPGFSVKLHVTILKILRLPIQEWLTETIKYPKGKASIKRDSRDYFYIHCNSLDYHYVDNKISDLLKVVANTAVEGKKTLLTFSSPQYYALTRRITNNINMYITDTLFGEPLTFHSDVVFTLHFRKCSPFS